MRWIASAIVLCGSLHLNGCLSPQETELPTVIPKHHPDVERKLYEYHDPFADSNLGPDIDHRPRGFHRQRTEPRRSADVYLEQLQFLPIRRPVEPYSPLGARYSQTVRPD